MIHRASNSLLKRRHFWRYASFSEVAELYASRLLRIFALNMISLFIAVYLYNQGYSLPFIFELFQRVVDIRKGIAALAVSDTVTFDLLLQLFRFLSGACF